MKKLHKKVYFTGITVILAILLVFTLFTPGCIGKAESVELYNQGIYYNNHYNQFDKALGYFNKSIELDPGNAQTWFAKSIALYNMKRYDESLESLNTTLALDPGFAAAWFQKGDVLRILGRGNESEESLAKAKQLGYY
ncbi:MAG TPA: tetratricopeptide repeat protein [Methanoregulaceae archaeon]|nr:tetratricopeptide repeat protein [Methanoregulaceae archaeon]